MNILARIFGTRKADKLTEVDKPKIDQSVGTPVNKSSWFLTHTETIANEFNFLETELNFKKLKNEFVGREHWTVYGKEPMEVEIWGDVGDLPFVSIRNKDLPYDESKYLDNRDNIEAFNSTARQLRQNWTKRREPIQKLFMDNWLKKDNLDLSELDNDYENFGKQEHIEYLRQAAVTVRENIEFKKGKMKNVP
ncbi:hypothetical protein [uncultured Draconibacterium sp.]|uniref:hypothetical protein n=1 Tax=uncultured Draconibacterium sp. TaxID=1573823 RepID=UPI0029C731A3|nr:hypothetical protein [uncultured Draconibacterium sp.]